MIRHVASALLSPVLLAQGLVTRAKTLKLPEPPGPREGHVGDGALIRLLLAGDSAAAGVGAPDQASALAGRLVDALQADFSLRWKLVARTGATTPGTLTHLSALPAQRFDVAVTSLGVNDVTSHTGVHRWLAQQAALRDLLRRRFGVRLLIISGLPPMHGFPALPQPLRWHLGWRATLFDRAIRGALESEHDAHFLSLRFTEDRAAMAEDGFHPGPTVYAEWARRAAEMIRQNIAQADESGRTRSTAAAYTTRGEA